MYEGDRLFKEVDVTEDICAMQIRDVIVKYLHRLPRYNKSYRTANKSWLHLSFKDDDCTISFYFRSWRYVNVTFNVNNHKLP